MTQTVRSGFGVSGIVTLLAFAWRFFALALFPQVASTVPVCTGGTCTEVFNTSGIFTAPVGVTSVTIEAWGGGGSGGWREDNPSGGGGGGAYASGAVAVTPGANYPVTVGAGGVATTGSSGTVQNGGDSSFTGDASQQVLAKGGTAGSGTGASGAGGAGLGFHQHRDGQTLRWKWRQWSGTTVVAAAVALQLTLLMGEMARMAPVIPVALAAPEKAMVERAAMTNKMDLTA